MNTPNSRSQKRSSAQSRTEQVTIRLEPRVKADLQYLAAQEGISVSATGEALIVEGIRQRLDSQHAVLMSEIIATAIHKNMRAVTNQLALLLVRVYLETAQNHILTTTLLSRQLGMSHAALKTLVQASHNTAKTNLTTRSHALKNLIAEMQAWLEQEEKEQAA